MADFPAAPVQAERATLDRLREEVMRLAEAWVEEEIDLMLVIGLPRGNQDGITAKRDAARAALLAVFT